MMQKCPVMMIDDDEVDRYLLKRMLDKLDLTNHIFEATNGQTALDYLTDNHNQNISPVYFPPKVIFLDINMPIMNGFEFLDAFASLRENNPIYTSSVLTMFTSSENDRDKMKASEYDFVKGYLVKDNLSLPELEKILTSCFSPSGS